MSLIAVAAGGFAGGVARWALSHLNTPDRKVGTWAANVVGSAVLGFTIGLPGLAPLLFGTGFAGGLSTWSTLAKELGEDLRARRWRTATTYAALTAATGIVAAYYGTMFAARAFAE
ncbi:CrcB family protein [Corynebacterium sp. LK2510]|uniref:CrcB family protein n=1 Tax=Corynebacterium sp. LK2510 TaxID=3110472 RepID=UPI0034CD279F